MTEQVAVLSFEDMLRHFDKLRRNALLFDRVAVSELTTKLAARGSQGAYDSLRPERLADLQSLVDQGVLFDPHTNFADDTLMDIPVHRDYLSARAAVQSELETLLEHLSADKANGRSLVVGDRMEVNAGLSAQECNIRLDAALMRRELAITALTLLPTYPGPISWRETAPTDIMRIAAAGLPMPADSVKWQTIQELRADNESKSKLRRLRAWITDVATKQQSLKQILEALKDLISDYHRYLNERHVTVRFCSIGTIVIVSPQFGEEFAKGERIKTNLMSIRHSRASLMESELGDVGVWVTHYEPHNMSNPLSEADAERLSNTTVSFAEQQYLRQYYELNIFLRQSAFDQFSKSGQAEPLGRSRIHHWADKAYESYSAERKCKLTIEENRQKFEQAAAEHEDSSLELLGDYPRKLKKWALYCLSDYAEQLADVPFAAFRLDDLNACSILLPTGKPAVIVNTATLTSVPFIVSAFMGLYDRLFARDKQEEESHGSEVEFLFKMARATASRDYGEVIRLQKDWARDGFKSYQEIAHGWALFVTLHECAHIVLNHLSAAAVSNTQTRGMEPHGRSRQLEWEADELAIKFWLFIDPEPTLDHALHVAAACTCVFGFFQLVSNVSSERSDSHPEATYRWTAIRPHLLSVAGAKPLVEKFEEMIQMLATLQQWL
jgi:hypothetical protein